MVAKFALPILHFLRLFVLNYRKIHQTKTIGIALSLLHFSFITTSFYIVRKKTNARKWGIIYLKHSKLHILLTFSTNSNKNNYNSFHKKTCCVYCSIILFSRFDA